MSLLLRLWPHVRPDAWAFALALFITPLIAGVSLVQPMLIKRAIDQHIVPIAAGTPGLDPTMAFSTVALFYLVAVVLAYLLEVVYVLAISWAGQRTILRMRKALYRHALSLAQSFFDREPAGRLLTRLTSDLESLGDALAAGVVTIFLDILMITGILVAMFWLDARLTVALLMMSPILVLALEVMRRQLRRLYTETREAIAAVNAYMAERVDGVQIIQLYRDEERVGQTFAGLANRYRRATSTSNIYDALMYSVVDGMSSICLAVMLWFGLGFATQAGLPVAPPEAVSAGLVVAFIDYMERLFRPLRDLSGKVTVIQRALAALEKVYSLFDTQVHVAGGETEQTLGGHLVMRDVRFRYRADRDEILRGVDLEVEPGEVVAVVGSTGAGKTTLVRMLDRSYDGYTGSITLDGVELRELALPALRSQVAAVRQDIQIFSEPVQFNVDLDNPGIDDADRSSAAELVHADGFIQNLGWGHLLRDRGADLSVGEGQLLTFARTMAHDPRLVILDEATASVDSLTESLIQDAIERIFKAKTVIVIAHRLSTIKSADRIVVMEAGQVVETGTHEALLAQGGRYAELISASEGLAAG